MADRQFREPEGTLAARRDGDGSVVNHTDAREAGAEHTHADISKANALLGDEPSRGIREGVREFVNWYRANHRCPTHR